jgi:hypothetical protein
MNKKSFMSKKELRKAVVQMFKDLYLTKVESKKGEMYLLKLSDSKGYVFDIEEMDKSLLHGPLENLIVLLPEPASDFFAKVYKMEHRKCII